MSFVPIVSCSDIMMINCLAILIAALLKQRDNYFFDIKFNKNHNRGCANAVPHYQKLRTRVSHVWGNRKLQLSEVQCLVSTWKNRLHDHGILCAR